MKTAKYNKYDVHLIETAEEMWSLLDAFNPKILVGLDTETSGLDYIEDSIAGVCVSGGVGYDVGHYAGYYIPVDHPQYPNNIPTSEVVQFVNRLFDIYKIFLFNRNFDFFFLEKLGCNVPHPGRTYDVQIMAHLVTNESFPSLKTYVKNYLKFDILTYESNNATNHSFKTTDPRTSFIYASQDPLVTVLLGRKLWAEYPYIKKIFKIDNLASEAVRRLEQNSFLHLDTKSLEAEVARISREIRSLEKEIFSFVGFVFKLNSNREVAEVLNRYVTLTKKTPTGSYKVDDEVLAQINHPLAEMIRNYRSARLRLNFVAKLASFPKEGWRASYSTVNVATGRLSSGTSRGNEKYFMPINIMNLPASEVKKSLQRSDKYGYTLEDYDEMPLGYPFLNIDGAIPNDEADLIEVTTEDGVYQLSPEVSVLCISNGVKKWKQVKNLVPDDELL